VNEEEAAEFNRRYREAGGCSCWVQVSLHDGHCCFGKACPDGCAEHDEEMLAIVASLPTNLRVSR
jgi:hypothetical protein